MLYYTVQSVQSCKRVQLLAARLACLTLDFPQGWEYMTGLIFAFWNVLRKDLKQTERDITAVYQSTLFNTMSHYKEITNNYRN